MWYFRIVFFFFKQKTAYELRISDWSSDVCSSDLLDDRRQLGLTGDRENDIADAPRWFIDRGAGDLDQQALLSIDPLDVFRDIAHHLALRARSDLVNGFDQQVDHRVRKRKNVG